MLSDMAVFRCASLCPCIIIAFDTPSQSIEILYFSLKQPSGDRARDWVITVEVQAHLQPKAQNYWKARAVMHVWRGSDGNPDLDCCF